MKQTITSITAGFFLLAFTVRAQTNFVGASNASTPGAYNVLIGFQTAQSIASNSWYNTMIGYRAGQNNTEGSGNVFVGSQSGQANTTGASNVFVGGATGIGNLTGYANTAIGSSAGYYNQSGQNNLTVGFQAGYKNTSSNNVMLGAEAGYSNTSGTGNAFVGYQAGYANNFGGENTFVGYRAGYNNSVFGGNTFVGHSSGLNSVGGGANTFFGSHSGLVNSSGDFNTMIGFYAGSANTNGSNNTFLGAKAGSNNTTGSNNIIIGPNSGTAITDASENVLIGYNSQAEDGLHNATAIGADSRVAISNAVILGNQANVGIGTSAPTARLDVVSESPDQSGVRLANLTSNSPVAASTDQFLTVNERGDIVKARYQLRINNASEWSDKVFAPSYRLRSLSAVADYIRQHGHLPNVPSANDVVQGGIDLTKMNATLLEKIEELTLYSIQLEKSNQQLQANDKKREAEVGELKELVKKLLDKKE